jgi:GNAT superfamily N-acetyltransferase
MPFDTIVRKVKRNLDDYGLWTTIGKSFAELAAPIYRHRTYRIYRINLKDVDTEPPPDSGEFRFRFLTVDDKAEIEHVAQYAEWLDKNLFDKIADGDLCLVAIHDDGEVAGFNLVSFGTVYIPLVELHRTFREDEAWSEHIAVHGPYRKKGLASQLRYHVFDELRRRGVRRFYGGTLSSNLPALKLARRVGFVELVDIHYYGVVGYEFWKYKRVRDV